MPNSNPEELENTETIIPNDQAALTEELEGGEVEFANMSQREQALVVKARSEEKRKLYNKAKKQEEQIAELQKSLKALQQTPAPVAPTRNGESRADKIDSLVDAMNSLIESQRATEQRIQLMQENEVKQRKEADLRRYAAEQISALRSTGEDLIAGLVGGDSEEEIDNSIHIANAEWKLLIQKHEASRVNPRPASVTVQNRQGRPAGTPPVQVANSVAAEEQENISDLTSADAVRDGSYEKNRSKLLGSIKRGYKYVSPNNS